MKNIKPLSEEKKYINSNVYGNEDQEIRNAFLKLEEQLREELKNPNELKIKTWINNYLDFVSKYEQVLDKDKLTSYMKEMFQKYDKSGTYYINLDKLIKGETKEVEKRRVKIKPLPKTEEKVSESINETKNDEPLKILNIKKYKFDFAKQNTLKALALIGIGSTVGVPTALMSVGVMELFRRYAIKNPKLKEFLESHEIQVDNKQVVSTGLYDNGIVRERTIMAKAGFLKRLLINFNTSVDRFIMKEDKMISDDYKKNKITSMLLDVRNEISLEDRFKVGKEEIVEESNNVEIHKGMGKC